MGLESWDCLVDGNYYSLIYRQYPKLICSHIKKTEMRNFHNVIIYKKYIYNHKVHKKNGRKLLKNWTSDPQEHNKIIKIRNTSLKVKSKFKNMRGTPEVMTPIFFPCILVTLTWRNFARVLRIVTLVCIKSFEWIQRVLYVFSLCNGELERNSDLQLQGVKCNSFFNNRK